MLVTSCTLFYKLIQQHFIVMLNPRSSPVTSRFVSTVVISEGSWTEKWQSEILCSSNLLWKCTGELTVGLLVAGAGSRSTELLGLAATRVSDQQGPVVLDQDVLDLFLGSLIHICNTSEFGLHFSFNALFLFECRHSVPVNSTTGVFNSLMVMLAMYRQLLIKWDCIHKINLSIGQCDAEFFSSTGTKDYAAFKRTHPPSVWNSEYFGLSTFF